MGSNSNGGGGDSKSKSGPKIKVVRRRGRLYEKDSADTPESASAEEKGETRVLLSEREVSTVDSTELAEEIRYEIAMRDLRALDIIKQGVIFSVGTTALPLPIFDVVCLSAVQLRMLRKLSELYAVEFQEERMRAFIAALIGGVLPVSVGRRVAVGMIKLLPGIGTLAGSLAFSSISGASTYAVGHVFKKHFDAGGTLLSFEPEKARAFFRLMMGEGERAAKQVQIH